MEKSNQQPGSGSNARQNIDTSEVWAVINGMEYLTPATLAILQERAEQWRQLYPHGEPMAKRPAGYHAFIHSDEIARVLGISLRQAQKMLKLTRKVQQKDKNGLISVKEFCFVNKLDEAEFRRGLHDLKNA